MFATLATFLKTVTGKAVLGVIVASTTVGAAAAAGAPIPVIEHLNPDGGADEPADEPAVEPASQDDGQGTDQTGDDQGTDQGDGEVSATVESEGDAPNHGQVVSEFARTTDLEGCARGQAVAGVARGDLDPESDTFDADLAQLVADRCSDDQTADDSQSDGEHGQLVSDFAKNTELEGCEKGQAVAGVARGDLDPEGDTFDADLADLTAGRCDNGPTVGTQDLKGAGHRADAGRPNDVPAGPPSGTPGGAAGGPGASAAPND